MTLKINGLLAQLQQNTKKKKKAGNLRGGWGGIPFLLQYTQYTPDVYHYIYILCIQMYTTHIHPHLFVLRPVYQL